MNSRTTTLLVSETHWDRAWYQPFQIFRLRLVRLIDRLLTILDSDPQFESFMLDGQLLPIEDYLEIRPERRADLERLVKAGRLYVGPWYVLADEYLVSPEALIRNLALGMRLAKQLGGVMAEGYVPDSFGHIGQLPQILQGFGIDSALFWRGMGDEGERLGLEFNWQAADGSQVLALHLRDGYHNASNLGYPMRWGNPGGVPFASGLATAQLQQATEQLRPHSRSNIVLLLNGSDHLEADARVPQLIAAANRQLADVQIVHSSLPDYVARVRAAVGDELPTFCGEMNRGRYAYHLQGVYSSRIYLLQANEQTQTLLERQVEPLRSCLALLGVPYPAPFIDLAWRKLLQNQPHDDICGCSVDAVHRENMTRFAEVEQIGRQLLQEGMRALSRRIDRGAQPGAPLLLFNPLPQRRVETLQLTLSFDEEELLADSFHIVTAEGEPLPCQLLGEERLLAAEVGKHQRVRRRQVALAVDLPPCGYQLLYLNAGDVAVAVDQPLRSFANGMENRYLRVEIADDGSLTVYDKRSGRRFSDQQIFIDEADAGDEYDYSPCAEPQPLTSRGNPATIELLHDGPLLTSYRISYNLTLPQSLSADRDRRSQQTIDCPIVSIVTLRHDSEQIDIETVVENRAKDHRLRVIFASDVVTETVAVDGHFDVLQRPLRPAPAPQWQQPPVATAHQRGFVSLSDGESGLAIFNRGLPEYEILDDGRNTIAITLLRCVGWLSRDDLLTRAMHAGPGLPTPEAQCLGRHTFSYAIAPHRADWQTVWPLAERYRAGVIAGRADEQEWHIPPPEERAAWPQFRRTQPDRSGALPARQAFLEIEPAQAALSAFKQSDDGKRLIVRCYNPSDDHLTLSLRCAWSLRRATRVNLAESPLEALAVAADGRSLTLPLAAKKIVTVALEFTHPFGKEDQ